MSTERTMIEIAMAIVRERLKMSTQPVNELTLLICWRSSGRRGASR